MKICWFSCGFSSFTACYLAKDVDQIIYTHVVNQHKDRLRFLRDCEKLLGRKIEILQSDQYDSVDDVIEKTRCINTAYGAPCTKWLATEPVTGSLFHMLWQEAIKRWEKLEIKNDFLFAKVMQDKKICRMLLEKLLKIKIKDIIYLEEQKTLDIQKDAKSVRLDVYIEGDNRIFDLEMQTTSNKNLPRRSRYYQGIIDLNALEKGTNYKKLKESYVIFICTFDPFHQEKAQYTFENLCLEDVELKLNDGTKKIFFNTNGYINAEDEDVREFLKYVNGEVSDNQFVKELEEKVAQVKANKKWRLEYVTLLMREEEIKEETWEEARKESIKKLVSVLKDLNIPSQIILTKLQEEYDLSPEASKKYL